MFSDDDYQWLKWKLELGELYIQACAHVSDRVLPSIVKWCWGNALSRKLKTGGRRSLQSCGTLIPDDDDDDDDVIERV